MKNYKVKNASFGSLLCQNGNCYR